MIQKVMTYIGIKFISAVPMTAEVAEKKGYRVSGNKGCGYEVTYEDGYKSWCPKDIFEQHNYTIKNKELAKSCELMVSPDYKKRFKAEYIQLKNRFEGLRGMIDAWDNGLLSFTPTCPRDLYSEQLTAMKLYLKVLISRARKEGIDIENTDTCRISIRNIDTCCPTDPIDLVK